MSWTFPHPEDTTTYQLKLMKRGWGRHESRRVLATDTGSRRIGIDIEVPVNTFRTIVIVYNELFAY